MDGSTLSEAHQRLIRKLRAIHALADDDIRALALLPLRIKAVERGVDLDDVEAWVTRGLGDRTPSSDDVSSSAVP